MKRLLLYILLMAACCAGAAGQQGTTIVQLPITSRASQDAPLTPLAKTWFVRLIPPRPTFDKDMTAHEQKLMEEHFVYWKGQFDKGVCLFGGPVLDPKGVYGVLAIRAVTEAEARAIAEADPSVVAGVNRIELAEMRLAFLGKQR
jgi:uncharacterized protein YciI